MADRSALSRSALVRANEVRIARAELKARIYRGEASAADVLRRPPPEAEAMEVGELLLAQKHWGATRVRRLLGRLRINETKTIASALPRHPLAIPLTERQREAIAERIEALQ